MNAVIFMSVKKIIIADDHRLFAEGIAQLLEKRSGVKVVCIVKNGNNVQDALKEYKPDV